MMTRGLVLGLAVAASPPDPARRVVTASGWKIRYSRHWFEASDGRSVVRSSDIVSADPDPGVRVTVRVLSIVGTIISYEYEQRGAFEGGHPVYARAFGAVDVARGRQQVSAADVFARAPLREALSRDRLVTAARVAKGVVSGCTPPDPAELEKLPFAVHHVEGSDVAVRIAIPTCGTPDFAQLGILVPIPDRLREPLAAARRNGTLMEKLGR